MEDKVLGLLGLMRRAKAIEIGTDNAVDAVHAGRAKLLLLSGDIEQVMGDEGNAVPDTFTLTLTPGDAPGTWKRQYVITPGS